MIERAPIFWRQRYSFRSSPHHYDRCGYQCIRANVFTDHNNVENVTKQRRDQDRPENNGQEMSQAKLSGIRHPWLLSYKLTTSCLIPGKTTRTSANSTTFGNSGRTAAQSLSLYGSRSPAASSRASSSSARDAGLRLLCATEPTLIVSFGKFGLGTRQAHAGSSLRA